MTQASLERQIGHIEGQLAALERQVSENTADTKKLLALANQQAGGWKAIMLVAGVAGTLGALGTKLVGMFWVKL